MRAVLCHSVDGIKALSIGEAALRLNATPKQLTDGMYRRWFDNIRCPIVSGRRMIPEDYLDEMSAVLRQHLRGKTPKSR